MYLNENSSISIGKGYQGKSGGSGIGPKTEKVTRLQHVDFSTSCDMCALLKAFQENSFDLTHTEHMVIATNLLNISGSRRKFMDWIEQAGSDRIKWEFDWIYMRDHNYMPMACEGNCRYADICNHEKNMLLSFRQFRYIKKITETEYVPVDDSYLQIKSVLHTEMQDHNPNNIALIKAQTGIGKTRAYLEALHTCNNPVIIAVPTVTLKHEVAQKAGNLAVEMISLKDLMLPTDTLSKVQNLYNDGHYKEAKMIISCFEKELPDTYNEQRARIKRYLKGAKALEDCSDNLIMTHAQLLNLSDDRINEFNIIVDEDILLSMLRNTRTIPEKEVQKALDQNLIIGEIADDLKKLLSSTDGTYLKTRNNLCDTEYITLETKCERNVYGNINDLKRSGSFCKENGHIHFFVPSNLPKAKTIVLSATLNRTIYEYFFKDRSITYHCIPPARYTGKLVQYVHHSMSRKMIEQQGSYQELEDSLFQTIKDKPDYEIGFNKYEHEFSCKDKLHFGATAGIDCLKGKNGIIIGTPHCNESSYKLIGNFLGVDVMNEHLANRRITYGSYEFNFMTYADPLLRELQLYIISSELEQSIGRSRLLRTNSTVYLFSNFPCEQADLIYGDYLNKTDVPHKDTPAA